MLIVLSPAKKLDLSQFDLTFKPTKPEFVYEAQTLVNILVDFSPSQLASLMKISDQLATLNLARFANFSAKFSLKNAKPAVFAFAGDAYQGLNPHDFDKEDLDFMQQHLRILSGLYGILRPLDLLQAYRLEMGTKLKNPKGSDLYAFWHNKISQNLQQTLQNLNSEIIINLASNEYFKAVNLKQLNAKIINVDFKDFKNGKYKMISFYAKKARGMMARFIIKNKLSTPERLTEFGAEDYRFCEIDSNPTKLVFLRD